MSEIGFSIGDEIEIEIEIPRFGFIKRKSSGEMDFISPIPSFFNYGFVPGTKAPDGDPWDALLMGPRVPRGHQTKSRIQGWVRFIDAGAQDDKIVCKAGALTQAERRAIDGFFRAYAGFKRALNGVRGRLGRTAYEGIADSPPS